VDNDKFFFNFLIYVFNFLIFLFIIYMIIYFIIIIINLLLLLFLPFLHDWQNLMLTMFTDNNKNLMIWLLLYRFLNYHLMNLLIELLILNHDMEYAVSNSLEH
jgi:hypothetical protein